MAPLQNLNTYFQNMDTFYRDTQWKDYDTQAKLNHGLILALTAVDPDSNDKFVTEMAFAGVETAVYLCLEDWPKAAGSIWNMTKAIWKKLWNRSLEDELTAVLQNYPNYPNVSDEQLLQIREAFVNRITQQIQSTTSLQSQIDALTTRVNALEGN